MPDSAGACRTLERRIRVLAVLVSVIAEASFGAPRVGPVDYRLEIDPDLFQPGRKFAVIARVFPQGFTLRDLQNKRKRSSNATLLLC
jgi:uncharacterized lipoprotein YbaY